MPLIKIPRAYYGGLEVPNPNGIEVYSSPNPVMRWVFWERLRRIDRMLERYALADTCLDFGGGSGAFLPTLARRFRQVDCIDLEPANAVSVVGHYSLSNVRILRQDVAGTAEARYQAIVAADVLEHFRDLDMPIDAIRRRLQPGGMLFTSLPTENWLYRLLRRVLRIEKPVDHYHTAYEVEARLAAAGFSRLASHAVPLPVPAPLFLVSAWKAVA